MTNALGRIRPISAREVWPHEALDFTPWLLSNVDVLSDLLGMDLVLQHAEHPVGSFSLDLIGTDESTGQTVIVENQLEMSDHTHLGQILTYAAGTSPTTIVWLATGFRPEHRAAIDWLNERTDENTRFFGVEIQVVCIGDSLPAPAFRLIAQPNDWGKHVKAATAGQASEKSQQYWDFWQQFLARVKSQHPGWSRARTSSFGSWVDMSLAPGVAISTSFTRAGLSVTIYFGSPDESLNSARFQSLATNKVAFENALGQTAIWDAMHGRKAARIGLVQPSFASVSDTEQWSSMFDWLIETQRDLRTALAAVGGVPTAI